VTALIRIATETDLPQLIALDSECFPKGRLDLQPAADGELIAGIESGASSVAIMNDQIVGFAQLELLSPQRWELLTLAITASARGQGVGAALLQRVIELRDQAPQRPSIEVLTAPSNAAMRGLLERFGFISGELIPDYYGPGSDRISYLLP